MQMPGKKKLKALADMYVHLVRNLSDLEICKIAHGLDAIFLEDLSRGIIRVKPFVNEPSRGDHSAIIAMGACELGSTGTGWHAILIKMRQKEDETEFLSSQDKARLAASFRAEELMANVEERILFAAEKFVDAFNDFLIEEELRALAND